MPKTIYVAGRRLTLLRTFKHDFFAATGLYGDPDNCVVNKDKDKRLVLKISRVQPFCTIPLAWLGRFLKNRELRLLKSIQTLEQVPRLIDEYGRNGFVYRYIEGKSLDENPEIPDAFFEDLKLLLHRIHQAGICYLDLNKRGNILLGKDNRPYMIDFQISLLLNGPCSKRLCRMIQREDYYHLLKHKRRLRPDLMSESEKALSRHKSVPIRIHRFLTVPLRNIRRRLLSLLYRNQFLMQDDSFEPTPENDPSRFGSS